MRAALERGEDVNSRDAIRDSNWTPLMHTAGQHKEHPFHENHVSILRLLLEHPSIEVNLAGEKGVTALHLASLHGNIEAVELMLASQRLDVNCKDWKLMTPLMIAAEKVGNIDIFKLLLADPRVDVNCVASHGPTTHSALGELTTLMMASGSSNVEATELLLDDQRVDLNWMNSMTRLGVLHTLVTLPKRFCDLKLVKLFLAHPRVDVNWKCGPLGETILHMAAALCLNVEVVTIILAEPRFTSANALNDNGDTAVAVAVINSNWDALKVLIHHPSIDLEKNGRNVDDLVR